MEPTVEKIRDGLRITIEDADTDTLAIVEVTSSRGRVAVRSGLRGNFSVKARPIQWVVHSIAARSMTDDEREQLKTKWFRDNAWRFR